MAAKNSVLGLVGTRAQAEAVLDDLQHVGFGSNDLSVLFPDREGTRDFAHEHDTKAPEGAALGGASGMGIGGTIGLLAGIGALAIPGVGPLIAAGPILAALSGAAAGGLVGGLAGGLIGLGIPEIEAKQYAGKINNGNLLLSIHVEDSKEENLAKTILERHGATDIVTVGEQAVPPGMRRSA